MTMSSVDLPSPIRWIPPRYSVVPLLLRHQVDEPRAVGVDEHDMLRVVHARERDAAAIRRPDGIVVVAVRIETRDPGGREVEDGESATFAGEDDASAIRRPVRV